MKKYKNVIFTGSSGGGYPSLYFSSYFNKIALISNSQIYLEEYYNFLNILKKKLIENNDELLYDHKNIEKQIINNYPLMIYLYNNIKDDDLINIPNAYYIPFLKFIKDNNLNNILELKLFEGIIEYNSKKTQHSIIFPDNKLHISIIEEIIKKKL
jgi:hypothetical protein